MDGLSARGNKAALTADAHHSSQKNNCVEVLLPHRAIGSRVGQQRNYATMIVAILEMHRVDTSSTRATRGLSSFYEYLRLTYAVHSKHASRHSRSDDRAYADDVRVRL